MQRFLGTPLDDVEALAARGLDCELPLRRGVKAWLEAAIVHGSVELAEDRRGGHLGWRASTPGRTRRS